jgi:poly(3-hydroxybutyrate) depolymerase
VLSVPAAYNSASPTPLVFAWHGLGGTGMLARQYFRIEQASAGQAIFVYPTGLPNSSGSNAWDLTANGIDVQFFDALVANVSGRYCVDMNRVFSAGHSFGAYFTNRLGCSRGNVLRAIAPVAGAPPVGSGGCMGEVAAWIAHGSNDATVAFTNGERTRDFWRTANGCGTTSAAITPVECVGFDGCRAGLSVHWCVHTMGHNWPTFAGTAIWAFFAGMP